MKDLSEGMMRRTAPVPAGAQCMSGNASKKMKDARLGAAHHDAASNAGCAESMRERGTERIGRECKCSCPRGRD